MHSESALRRKCHNTVPGLVNQPVLPHSTCLDDGDRTELLALLVHRLAAAAPLRSL